MPGKVIKQENKFKKWFLILGIAGVIGVGSGLYYYNFQKGPSDKNITALTSDQQKSLIETATKLVKQNTKPKEIYNDLGSRIEKLDKQNQYLAMDLIYTSIQNATFYYNSTGSVMSGEIEYNRKTSRSSIAAANNSAWVSGFVRDLKDQHLKPFSISGAQILSLPNWEDLKNYQKYSSSELSILIETGAEAEKFEIFNSETGAVDAYQAFKAYETVLEGLNKLSKENQSSKYLADLNSLARFYHDVALGVIITDNIELDSDGTTYTLTTSQVQALEKIKNEAKDPVIAKEAGSILGVLKDKNKAPGNFLKNIAKESQKRFGSSVYWQAEQDLSSIVTKKTLTEKEKKEEESGGSNENN